MAAKLDILLSPIAQRRFPIPVPDVELLELLPYVDPAVCLPDFELAGVLDSNPITGAFPQTEPIRLKPAWVDYSWEATFAMDKD